MTEILYQGNERGFAIERLSDEMNFHGTGKRQLAKLKKSRPVPQGPR
jgi:hypothetical protein